MTNIPCPECLGCGEDDFGTCLRCEGHGYVQEQPIAFCSECGVRLDWQSPGCLYPDRHPRGYG